MAYPSTSMSNGRILVMCASRGRPHSLEHMTRSVRETSAKADVVAYADSDQKELYQGLSCQTSFGPRVGQCRSLSALAMKYPGYDVYGAATDDCLFRTKGWDDWVLKVASEFPSRVGAIAPFTSEYGRMDFPWVTEGWLSAAGVFCPIDTRHSYWDVGLQVAAEQVAFKAATMEEFFIEHLALPPALEDGEDFAELASLDQMTIENMNKDAKTVLTWIACGMPRLVAYLRQQQGDTPTAPPRESMYYSDNGIDARVEPLLPKIGHACEVGANNGYFSSNTLHYEQKGWTVLCIEPNPAHAEKGMELRALWRQVAAGDKNGRATFTQFGPFPWGGSGLEDRYQLSQSYADPLVKTEVEVRTLDTLLEEAGFPKLDFLSIDCEGYEPEVLRGFTVERWKPAVIVAENHIGRDSPKPQFEIPGYRYEGRYAVDEVYVREVA